MSISFGVAALCTFATVILTGALLRWCTRVLRIDLAALAVAAAGLTLALAAQAAGYHGGFGPTTFRALEIGARLIAPLGLVWALAETTGKSVAARFMARLALGALSVVAAVILAIDPLSGKAFNAQWPPAPIYYQLIPAYILKFIVFVTAISAVIALLVAGLRARRDPGWREIFGVVAPVGLGALATLALRMTTLPRPAYPMVCLLVAVLATYAGKRASQFALDELQAGAEPGWDDREPGYQPYGYNAGYDGYGEDTGAYGAGGGDTDFGGGWYRSDRGEFHGEGADTGFGLYRDPDFETGGLDQSAINGIAGTFETGDLLPGINALNGALEEQEETSRLYGQIAIYTLIEEDVNEFDRLAQQVVAKVKANEPGTNVFVMHGVPSAPMQRILYEVYRDEAAFEEHNHQPYVVQFEKDRKPYVLATNVIQLGVRDAMFAKPPGRAPVRPASPRALPAGSSTSPPGLPAAPAPDAPAVASAGPADTRRPSGPPALTRSAPADAAYPGMAPALPPSPGQRRDGQLPQGQPPPGRAPLPSGQGQPPPGRAPLPSGQGPLPSGQGPLPSGEGPLPSGQSWREAARPGQPRPGEPQPVESWPNERPGGAGHSRRDEGRRRQPGGDDRWPENPRPGQPWSGLPGPGQPFAGSSAPGESWSASPGSGQPARGEPWLGAPAQRQLPDGQPQSGQPAPGPGWARRGQPPPGQPPGGSRPGASPAGESWFRQSSPGQSWPDQERPGSAASGQARPGHSPQDQPWPGQAPTGQPRPREPWLGNSPQDQPRQSKGWSGQPRQGQEPGGPPWPGESAPHPARTEDDEDDDKGWRTQWPPPRQ